MGVYFLDRSSEHYTNKIIKYNILSKINSKKHLLYQMFSKSCNTVSRVPRLHRFSLWRSCLDLHLLDWQPPIGSKQDFISLAF